MNLVFASIRSMMISSMSDWDLGVFARKHIAEKILPELRRLEGKSKNDIQMGKVKDLIEEYSAYLDRSNSKSNAFGKRVDSTVRFYLGKSGLGQDEVEDLEQDIMLSFLQPRTPTGKTAFEVLDKFDALRSNPSSFAQYWGKVVSNITAMLVRNRINMERPSQREDISVLEDAKAPAEIVWDNNIVSDLSKYVHSKISNPKYAEMFDIWLEAAQNKGANKVDMKNDVYLELKDRGYDGRPNSMSEYWNLRLLPVIREFFVKEFELDDTNMVRRIVGTTTEVVAYTEYRRQMAGWILGLV